MEHLLFKHPFTALISGPSSSGKTYFVRELIENFKPLFGRFSKPRLNVLWCYGIKQSLHKVPFRNADVKVTYVEGVPGKQAVQQDKPDLLVIDDQMGAMGSSDWLVDFFTQQSHHWNISVIFVVQNVFHKGTKMREISLNSQYIVLMRNPRDKLQVINLGRQLFPGKKKYFEESFTEATRRPYKYLVIDNTIDTPENLRLRTDIFPTDIPQKYRTKCRLLPTIFEAK